MLPKVDYVLMRALRLYEPEVSVQAEGIYECIVWNHLAAGRWFFFIVVRVGYKNM